jgi:hypothetical protein
MGTSGWPGLESSEASAEPCTQAPGALRGVEDFAPATRCITVLALLLRFR